MRFCTQCGAPLANGAQFCSKCGAPAAPAPAPTQPAGTAPPTLPPTAPAVMVAPPTAPAVMVAPPPRAAPSGGRPPAVIGLLLLVPVLIAWILSFVLPSVSTLRDGLYRIRGFGTTSEKYVGFDNYRDWNEQFTAYGNALKYAVLPLLVVAVVAPLLAYAAHRAGRIGRWVVRLAFAVPMALVAPTLLALAWARELFTADRLNSLDDFRIWVPLAAGLSMLGLVSGVAVTAYLAAFRRPGTGGSRAAAALIVGGLLAIGVLAVALQTLAFPLVFPRGVAMAGATQTPQFMIMTDAFLIGNLGFASARATVLIAVLALLGIGAWLLIFLGRLRVEVTPKSGDADRKPSVGWAVAGGVVLLLVLALVAYGLWPWLSNAVGGTSRGPSAGKIFVDTWLPPLVSTVVGVGLAALGGFAIGALRPLGRFSELLLLPFAPFLFFGLGPLSIANIRSAAEDDKIGTFVGLIPPVWLAVPALFLFTVLFRGLAGQAGGRLSATILPALPMVALAGIATWLVHAQDITWTYFTAESRVPGPVVGLRVYTSYFTDPELALSTGYPLIAVLIVAAVLAVAQLLYLDRLAIRIGRD